MLDFRRNNSVPNYLGSRQQRRWLMLLTLAGIVAIFVFQPGGKFLERWFAPGAPADPLIATHEPPAHQADASSDKRAKPRTPAERDAIFPGVRADYLTDVRDDQVFRTAESNAWFHLLALLDKTDEQQLAGATLGPVGYLQLDQQSEWYRGRLVTVAGTVRSARLVAAPENDFGVKEYYQLWLQPDPSSPKLVVVYSLKLPEGFPLGQSLAAPCQAVGFFFKRWAYQSQEGVTTAPLVLAKTIAWTPPPVSAPAAPLGEQLILAVVAALFLSLLIVGYFVTRSRGPARQRLAADSRAVEAAMQAHHGPPSAATSEGDNREVVR